MTSTCQKRKELIEGPALLQVSRATLEDTVRRDKSEWLRCSSAKFRLRPSGLSVAWTEGGGLELGVRFSWN
jgi:hypothetical protein